VWCLGFYHEKEDPRPGAPATAHTARSGVFADRERRPQCSPQSFTGEVVRHATATRPGRGLTNLRIMLSEPKESPEGFSSPASDITVRPDRAIGRVTVRRFAVWAIGIEGPEYAWDRVQARLGNAQFFTCTARITDNTFGNYSLQSGYQRAENVQLAISHAIPRKIGVKHKRRGFPETCSLGTIGILAKWTKCKESSTKHMRLTASSVAFASSVICIFLRWIYHSIRMGPSY